MSDQLTEDMVEKMGREVTYGKVTAKRRGGPPNYYWSMTVPTNRTPRHIGYIVRVDRREEGVVWAAAVRGINQKGPPTIIERASPEDVLIAVEKVLAH